MSYPYLEAVLRTHLDEIGAIGGMCLGLDFAILQRCVLFIFEELSATTT